MGLYDPRLSSAGMRWLNPQREPDVWWRERRRLLEPWPTFPPHPPLPLEQACEIIRTEVSEVKYAN